MVLTMALVVTTADAVPSLSAAEVTETRGARLGASVPEGRRVLQPAPGDSALVTLRFPLVTRNTMPDNHVTFAVIGEYGICGTDPAACDVEAKAAHLVKAWRPGVGSSAKRPAANCAFCSRMAAATSPGVRLYCATLSGLSQMRME